jgi:hypothetical protein
LWSAPLARKPTLVGFRKRLQHADEGVRPTTLQCSFLEKACGIRLKA